MSADTWVKVCGIRTEADLRAAEDAGADAVGLMLAPSPRRIRPEDARTLASRASIETFLVLVDATPTEVLDLASHIGASGIQPHGSGSADAAAAARRAGLSVLRPVRVSGPVDLSRIPDDQVPLLDAAVDGLHGGTGTGFDRSLVGAPGRRWVMAGGLRPGIVADAIAELRPWGVDASSGLESSPGVKDPDLIARYVQEAKSA